METMPHNDMAFEIAAGLPNTASQANGYRKKRKKRKKGSGNGTRDDAGPKGGSTKKPLEESTGSY